MLPSKTQGNVSCATVVYNQLMHMEEWGEATCPLCLLWNICQIYNSDHALGRNGSSVGQDDYEVQSVQHTIFRITYRRYQKLDLILSFYSPKFCRMEFSYKSRNTMGKWNYMIRIDIDHISTNVHIYTGPKNRMLYNLYFIIILSYWRPCFDPAYCF